MYNNEDQFIKDSVKQLKGTIHSGIEIENFVRGLCETSKEWSITQNTVDCSYDENENHINEFYIHIDLTNDSYTDLLCIINNIEDQYKDWVILIKDVITK